MRTILSVAAAVAMLWLGVAGAQQSHTKAAPKGSKTPPKSSKATAKKKPAVTSTARKRTSSTRTASASRGKKGAKRPATTWRNRQMAPTPDRYREIQSALVARGYLNSEDAGGVWNQASIDAMKRFQAEQNLDSSGKINSLSLIALGLGPRRDPSPALPTKPQLDQVRPGQ